MDKSSEASAFIAVLLTFFGLADLTAASLDALPALEYWMANVPIRLTVLFALTAYSWLFAEGGYLGPTLTAGRHLCNSWVFTFAFMELMMWYWVSRIALFEEYTNADFLAHRSSLRSGKKGRLLPTRLLHRARRRRKPILCNSCSDQRDTWSKWKSTNRQETSVATWTKHRTQDGQNGWRRSRTSPAEVSQIVTQLVHRALNKFFLMDTFRKGLVSV